MGITEILALLKGNWKVILGAGIIITALWYVEGLRLTIAHQDTKILTLTNDNATLTDNNANLQDAIQIYNTALIKTDNAAKTAQARMDALSSENSVFRQQQANTNKQLAEILANKDPVTCDDAIIYLISNIKGYIK